MDDVVIELLLNFGPPLVLIVVAYFTGRRLEASHYRSIAEREAANRSFLTVTFPYEPDPERVETVGLVSGNVVVSVDYFKRFLAALRNLVGGRMKAYETVLDRGRREALLRMQESARAAGCDGVINVRLETSRLATGRGDQGTAGVEVLAFGTGIRMPDAPESGA